MSIKPSSITFLIYETDPFILSDIEETLASSFPGYPVRVLDAVSDLTELQKSEADRSVLVVSADRETLCSLSKSVADITHQIGLVVISEAQSAMKELGVACRFVSRPFKSETIVDAVRDVLSTLQKTLP